MKSERKASLLW